MSSSDQVCALPGCSNPIEEVPGRPVRRYCCSDHRTEARKVRLGRARRDAEATAGGVAAESPEPSGSVAQSEFVPTDFVRGGNAEEVICPVRSPYQRPEPGEVAAVSNLDDTASRVAEVGDGVVQPAVDEASGQALDAADKATNQVSGPVAATTAGQTPAQQASRIRQAADKAGSAERTGTSTRSDAKPEADRTKVGAHGSVGNSVKTNKYRSSGDSRSRASTRRGKRYGSSSGHGSSSRGRTAVATATTMAAGGRGIR